MSEDDQIVEHRFGLNERVELQPRTMTRLDLVPTGDGQDEIVVRSGSLCFQRVGWYEVLLRVDWDPAVTAGTRFSHSKIPGQQPLHSEAIDAAVLAQISNGQQLLRGNTVFGHDHTSELVLECWHDAPTAVAITQAELTVRELRVPWTPEQRHRPSR
jgi:hypothetical protein